MSDLEQLAKEWLGGYFRNDVHVIPALVTLLAKVRAEEANWWFANGMFSADANKRLDEQHEYEQSQLHQDFRDEPAGEQYNDMPNNSGADLE